MNILPLYLGHHKTQLDSIQKIGMSLKQEEDEWQAPDKWQRILQMVFCGGCLEIHSYEARCISSSCTKHQGCECSICVAKACLGGRVDL